jgi:site-specific DNA-methyltransferase (cytosine-N4-specific)
MTKEEQQAGGANKRSVWEIATQPYPDAHFATFPEKLVEPCILAGSREGDTVLDPFGGSGTTAVVARKAGRKAILVDLNESYLEMARDRIGQGVLL